MHLAVAQAPVKLGNIAANLATARQLATQAREAGDGELDLLVLPELFISGYMLRDELIRLAEPLPPLPSLSFPPSLPANSDMDVMASNVGGQDGGQSGGMGGIGGSNDRKGVSGDAGVNGPWGFSHRQPVAASDFSFGPTMSGLLELASDEGCYITCGHIEHEGRGLFNAGVMVGPEGYIGHYRKMKLPHTGPFEEPSFFGEGGPDQRPVFSLPFGIVGLQVCYDIHFPLPSLRLARDGAQLICNLSAAPNTSRYVFERLLPARAIETSCYWAYANNVGVQETMMFWGGSQILDARGDVMVKAPYNEPGVAVAKIDLCDVESVRGFRPTLMDGAGDRLNFP